MLVSMTGFGSSSYEDSILSINIELKSFEQKDTLLFNLYRNSFSMHQANLNYNFKIGKWSTLISLHTTQPGKRIDNNKDGFLDLPLTQKNSFYSKSSYKSANKKLLNINNLNWGRIWILNHYMIECLLKE